jgi:hypothetical protein
MTYYLRLALPLFTTGTHLVYIDHIVRETQEGNALTEDPS